jgi:hypothetical protein
MMNYVGPIFDASKTGKPLFEMRPVIYSNPHGRRPVQPFPGTAVALSPFLAGISAGVKKKERAFAFWVDSRSGQKVGSKIYRFTISHKRP